MPDFSYERLRTQEAALEPYILYRKDQAVQAERNVRIRDFEYFKSMYPDRVKALQLVVEEVCDEMEYEGSPIYDEYPDRILMEQDESKRSRQERRFPMRNRNRPDDNGRSGA